MNWLYRDQVNLSAAFGATELFPLARTLQHFNLGYFFYDTMHVAVWDRFWYAHHIVAIAGFATSEIAGVFALANGVNTWITELGSIMYQVHLLVKSRASYTFFVFMYTLSRVYFAYWSISVLTQAWTALHDPEWGVRYPIWAPFCAGSLQVSLLGINSIFALKHMKKLGKQYAGPKKEQ